MARFLIPVMIISVVVHAKPASAALLLQSYDPEKHHRFYTGADDAFVGDAYDWSGVALGTDSDSHWATMISPSYFISANHFHPGNGANLRFFHMNDPSGPSRIEPLHPGNTSENRISGWGH